ncbi:MAG: pilus assembly PilX family protein [Thermodesulfobacteriota bacterium]
MPKKMVAPLKDQSGVALVIALIMIVILTLIGLASTYTSTFEIKLSGNKRGATDAFYAADSGVQVVVANVENFTLPGKYVDHKYDPFTDPNNPNPTRAKVTVTHDITQSGSPRGVQMSAIHFGFEHFQIESKGSDQLDLSPIRSICTVEEKVVRLVPTIQGGY